MFLCITANVLIFAYPYISRNLFSLYELSNLTNLNSFFQRTEIPFILCFLLISFLVLVSCFHALVYSYNILVNTKKKKSIIPNIIIALVVFYISTLPKNLLSTIDLQLVLKDYYIIPSVFVYPLILMVIAKIKYTKNRGEYEKNIVNSN